MEETLVTDVTITRAGWQTKLQRGRPTRGGPALSTPFNEPTLVQIPDPLVQVATVFSGARQDCQVSVVAVGGGGHDNRPGGRRTVARGDAVPGEFGS
jgi:hypothetical protein